MDKDKEFNDTWSGRHLKLSIKPAYGWILSIVGAVVAPALIWTYGAGALASQVANNSKQHEENKAAVQSIDVLTERITAVQKAQIRIEARQTQIYEAVLDNKGVE